MKIRIFEPRIIAVKVFQPLGWKEETWKNSGLNGNRIHDLYDIGIAECLCTGVSTA